MEEAEVVKDLLSANWNSANTNNVTPVIDIITNREKIDARQVPFVLLYNLPSAPISHSAQRVFDHQWTISIDIRTYRYTLFKLLTAETKRIIAGKYILPATDYHRLYLIRDVDLSDRTRGLYRRVIDVILTKDFEEVTAI